MNVDKDIITIENVLLEYRNDLKYYKGTIVFMDIVTEIKNNLNTITPQNIKAEYIKNNYSILFPPYTEEIKQILDKYYSKTYTSLKNTGMYENEMERILNNSEITKVFENNEYQNGMFLHTEKYEQELKSKIGELLEQYGILED